MSKRAARHLLLPKVMEAEIKAAKKQVGAWYYEFRRRVMVEKPSQLQLREMLEEIMGKVSKECASELAKLAYLRAFSIMLKRVGGPIKSADDLYDEAMGNVKGKDGPTEESIKQAMAMLGMAPPPDGESPGASTDGAAASPLAGAPDEPPARPRFSRSYPSVPPGEGTPPAASTDPADTP